MGDSDNTAFGKGASARADYDKRLLTLAKRMKKQGIIACAIQFGDKAGATAKVLKKAAFGNKSPYYRFAPDADSLK